MGLKNIMDYIENVIFNDVIHFLKGMNQRELTEESREIGNGVFSIRLANTEEAFSNSSQWESVRYKAFKSYHLPEGFLHIESLGKNDYVFFKDEMYVLRRLFPDMLILEDENNYFRIFKSGYFAFDFISRKMYKDPYLENKTVEK